MNFRSRPRPASQMSKGLAIPEEWAKHPTYSVCPDKLHQGEHVVGGIWRAFLWAYPAFVFVSVAEVVNNHARHYVVHPIQANRHCN